MTTYGIAEAKAKLSEIAARVEAGEDVVVTLNGEPAFRCVKVAEEPEAVRLGGYVHFADPDEDLSYMAEPTDKETLREWGLI